MLRLWGIIKKNNKMVQDIVTEYLKDDIDEIDQFHHCVHEICYEFDLQRPMWLPKNQREYEDYRRVILNQDNFIEPIYFDTLELEILEDDEDK